jgi:hypothetical protein
MNLIYYRSSDPQRQPFAGERNDGIEAVPKLLKQLEAKGHRVEIKDTATMTEQQRKEAYIGAIVPAVYRHYEVRRMFGSNRISASMFGAEVPALIVIDGNSAGDTYPHRKGSCISTIHSFLAEQF